METANLPIQECMRLLTIPCFILLLASCNSKTNLSLAGIGDTLSLLNDSLAFYFPAKIFHQAPKQIAVCRIGMHQFLVLKSLFYLHNVVAIASIVFCG